jgi:hypothetical protein
MLTLGTVGSVECEVVELDAGVAGTVDGFLANDDASFAASTNKTAAGEESSGSCVLLFAAMDEEDEKPNAVAGLICTGGSALCCILFIDLKGERLFCRIVPPARPTSTDGVVSVDLSDEDEPGVLFPPPPAPRRLYTRPSSEVDSVTVPPRNTEAA